MNFNKKEDRDNIVKLNYLVGTRHRSKPYDLKKAEDIIEATVMATAEFADMANYWGRLEELVEAFDESLEYYEPAAWIKIGLNGETGDEEIENARNDLESAADSLNILVDRAEAKCFTMWKTVLNCGNNEVVKHFFGEVIWFDENLLEKAFEEDLFEILDNIAYDGNIENSAESFAKALKEKLLELMREAQKY